MYAMCMKPFNGSRFNLGAKEANKNWAQKETIIEINRFRFFFCERVNEPTNQTCVHLDREMARIYKCIEKKTARDFGNILNDQKQGKKSALLEYRLCELWTLDGNL